MALNTEYSWKIVTYDQLNTTEGPVWSFTTLKREIQLSDIDGNTYSTVLIERQCWTKENLKTTIYNNGNSIPKVTDSCSWAGLTSGAFAWYSNDPGWEDKYGALYNWDATTDTNGLCPPRWHVPTNDEWTTLADYIAGIDSLKGNKLK